MKMMKITPVTLILVLLISGCADNRIEVNQTVTEPKPEVDQTPKEPSLNDYLGNVTIKQTYTVKLVSGYSSSGGTRRLNINYGVYNEGFTSCSGNYTFLGTDGTKVTECTLGLLMTGEKFKGLEKMADVVKELKSNSIRGEKSLKLKDRICFYDIRTRQWSKIVVCFNERNHLVNYGGTAVYGGSRYYWNIDGYIFTSQILKLIKLG